MFFKKKQTLIQEEGISITTHGSKISKKLKVFYNPLMKLNRDISLLIIDSYFDKEITFCDPMIASGIRELRFLKTIPSKFKKLILGDISKTAIKEAKTNFKYNKLSTTKIQFNEDIAQRTLLLDYADFIEIDPFGSPIPFLDSALQRIKHNGILSVTATDTAALCGTYPKTSLRKYGIKTQITYCHEELGLRNLIAYCQREGAKHELNLIPLISYSQDHYYKIFFRVQQSRTKSLKSIQNHNFIEWNLKDQQVKINKLEKKNFLGKTYIGPLCNKTFLKTLDINLLQDSKKAQKLITALQEEINEVGHYNPHKFGKHNKLSVEKPFDEIIIQLKKKGYKASRVHNNRFGIKTNASSKVFLNILKK